MKILHYVSLAIIPQIGLKFLPRSWRTYSDILQKKNESEKKPEQG